MSKCTPNNTNVQYASRESTANLFDGTMQDLLQFVVGSEPSADLDGDDDVDGNDFLAWQRGESPNPLSPTDLTVWQENFGTHSNPMMAVPETSCWTPLLAAFLCGFRWWRKL